MMQFKTLEEQIQYQEKNIEYLQQQNFDLQNQIDQYSQFSQQGITIESFQQLQNTTKEQAVQIKLLEKENKNLTKQIQNNQVKYYDKTLSNLQSENAKLKNEIRQLRQRISSPSKLDKSLVQYSTPQKQLNPSAILKSTKDQPKDVTSLMFIKGSPNFKSPYLDFIKGKYENVKLIKQLKSGLEQSYFDTFHFDIISQDLPQSLQQIDRQHSVHQGKGLLLSNQLCLIYGASRTNKKHFLIQYLDTLIIQIKQQFEIFQQNDDYIQLTVKITYEEYYNGVTKHPNECEIIIAKSNSKKENDGKIREAELSISKLKLTILNKLKMTIKDNSKKYIKIRKLLIETEQQLTRETQEKRVIVFTSNSHLSTKQFANAEEGLNELLAFKDKGKQLTSILRWPQLSISMVLCIHPTIPDYAQTVNTFQLCKIIRNLRLVQGGQDSPQGSEKFQQILENNNKSLEQKVKQLREKIRQIESENYKIKKQSVILEAENTEAVDKNRKLKDQITGLISQLQQLQMNFQQQISAKKSLSLSKTKSSNVSDNKTIQTLEKASRSISVLLQQQGKLDFSVSPSKVQRTLPSELVMPKFQDEEEDAEQFDEEQQEEEDEMENDVADSSEPSEEDESEAQEEEQQIRKESTISMI